MRAQSCELITEKIVKDCRKSFASENGSAKSKKTATDTEASVVAETDPGKRLDSETTIRAACNALVAERGKSTALDIIRGVLAELEAAMAPESCQDELRNNGIEDDPFRIPSRYRRD